MDTGYEKLIRPIDVPVASQSSNTESNSKYDRLTKPSQRLLDVGAALHRASRSLGLFQEK